MRPDRLLLVLVVLWALIAGLALRARAGEPTDQVRSHIEQLHRALQSSAPAGGTERQVDDILDRLFDWSRMAQTALRGHWQARTPAERTEFTALFAQLFRRAYVSRIHVVDASKFQYLGDTIQGDRATVKTKAFTKRGSGLDVDYAVRRAEGQRWRVEDVRVEQVSLLDNYSTQFNTFIARSSYQALVDKLRNAAKSAN